MSVPVDPARARTGNSAIAARTKRTEDGVGSLAGCVGFIDVSTTVQEHLQNPHLAIIGKRKMAAKQMQRTFPTAVHSVDPCSGERVFGCKQTRNKLGVLLHILARARGIEQQMEHGLSAVVSDGRPRSALLYQETDHKNPNIRVLTRERV